MSMLHSSNERLKETLGLDFAAPCNPGNTNWSNFIDQNSQVNSLSSISSERYVQDLLIQIWLYFVWPTQCLKIEKFYLLP